MPKKFYFVGNPMEVSISWIHSIINTDPYAVELVDKDRCSKVTREFGSDSILATSLKNMLIEESME